MFAVESIVCSALFYALYRLLLEGRVAHSVARGYLLFAVVLSVVIPLLELPILPAEVVATEVVTLPAEFVDMAVEVAAADAVVERTFDWILALEILYFAVVAIFAVRFAVIAAKICKLRRDSELRSYRGVTVAANRSVAEPFSFCRIIFVSAVENREQVLLHEYSHIAHMHTFERLFFEFARSVMWFNPFVHLMARAAAQVEEWQADGDVIGAGFNVDQYRQIIFHQLFGYSPDITCGLNNSLTKKRFIMMTNFKRGKFSLLRLCAVIPIVVAMIFAFGAVAAKAEPTEVATAEPEIVVEVRKAGEELLVNSEIVTIEQLPELVKQSEDKVVSIKAEEGVPMGKITDVKEALRAVEGVRINYVKPEALQSQPTESSSRRNGPMIKIEVKDGGKTILFCGAPMSYKQLLETLPQVRENKVGFWIAEDVPEQIFVEMKNALRSGGNTLKVNHIKSEPQTTTVEARNLLQVEVTADGTILLRGKQCGKSELKREVKHFVQNYHIYSMNTRRLHIGNPYDKEYSTFSTTSLTMPDGRRVCCPVSNGIVSVSSDKNAPFTAVNEVLGTIQLAYDELRQSLSRRVYNKSYDKLESPYKEMVNNAVPIRVYIAE